METYTLNFTDELRFTDEEFYHFCQNNPDLKLERDKEGNIIIMALIGLKTGIKNSELNTDLVIWNRKTKAGKVFDSSTGFRLPNTAIKSPDMAWISNEHWNSLSENDKEKFGNICPDFVVELMSQSDSLKQAQKKMNEWIENGCQLAWLIDTQAQKAYIYRQAGEVTEISNFQTVLSGEDVLPDFSFDLSLLLA